MNKDLIWAKNYVADMVKLHGLDHKKLRFLILNNLVNSQYGYTSNAKVDFVFQELKRLFPS